MCGNEKEKTNLRFHEEIDVMEMFFLAEPIHAACFNNKYLMIHTLIVLSVEHSSRFYLLSSLCAH